MQSCGGSDKAQADPQVESRDDSLRMEIFALLEDSEHNTEFLSKELAGRSWEDALSEFLEVIEEFPEGERPVKLEVLRVYQKMRLLHAQHRAAEAKEDAEAAGIRREQSLRELRETLQRLYNEENAREGR